MKLTVAKWEAKEGNTLEANGLIRVNPNKPTFGSLMLIAVTMVLTGSFLNKKTKVGFIVGKIDDLKSLISTYGLKEGTDYSAAVAPHRIVTIEKLKNAVPENQGFRQKINPTTGEVLTSNGEEIYWKNEVVAEGSNVVDQLIAHDREAVETSVQEFSGAAQNAGK